MFAAATLAIGAPARAQEEIRSEVRVGGGYDSNPSLAADPGNRRLGGGPPMPAVSTEDGLLRVGGYVMGRLGESPAGSARFDLDGRIYGSGDVLFAERLTLEGLVRADPVYPRCRVSGSRLDVSASHDSSWAGVLACGAIVRLPLGLFVAADVDGGFRAFDAGQLDGLFGGELVLGFAMELVAIEVSFAATRRESDGAQATRTELSPSAVVRLTTDLAGGEAGYRYIERIFESNARSGGEHAFSLRAWAMPLPWLGAYADLEVGHASGGPQALAYDRVQVTGGVRLVLDWRPEPAELPPPPAAQGPALVEDDGFVRFSFRFPDASAVSVVGDFVDWDEARGALERGQDGEFTGRFPLGAGRHEYHLIVDGEPVRPPGALRYVPDDFGGENAVVVVP